MFHGSLQAFLRYISNFLILFIYVFNYVTFPGFFFIITILCH
jgi:hypothetical protein